MIRTAAAQPSRDRKRSATLATTSRKVGRSIDHRCGSSSTATASSNDPTPMDLSSERFVTRMSSGSRPAARPAIRRASSSSSSSGTQRHAIPCATACSPSSASPKSTSAAAACRPPRRVSDHRFPPPGWIPTSSHRGSNRADGLTRITSQARGRFTPAPMQALSTAATVGTGQWASASKPAYVSSSGARGVTRSSSEPPAQNTGGSAASTIARAPRSTTSSTAEASARVISKPSALRRLGSDSVIVATPSSSMVSVTSWAITRPYRSTVSMPGNPAPRPQTLSRSSSRVPAHLAVIRKPRRS